MDYVYVTDFSALAAIAAEVDAASAVGLDIETTSLSPRKGKIRLVQLHTGKGWYVIDVFRTGGLGPVLEALNGPCLKLIQNAKFEQKWFLHKHGLVLWPLFDTFRASFLIHNGKNEGHNLYDLYLRELNVKPGPSDMGASDWSGTLSKEQLDYAAEDVQYLHQLYVSLRAQLAKWGLLQIALIEFGAVLGEAAIELNGFRLDADWWRHVADKQAVKEKELRAQLDVMLPHPRGQTSLPGIPSGFNLRSPQQVKDSFARLGIKVESTKKETMGMLAYKHPSIPLFMEYRAVSKRLTSFGINYLSNIDKETGRIHVGLWPFTGAGRYSCSKGETTVKTFAGNKRLDEVRVGDLVWSHRNRWCRVSRVWANGVRQTYDVRFSTGDLLSCTGDHRLLPSTGPWALVEDLYREHFEELDIAPDQPCQRARAVQAAGATDHAGACGEAGDDFPQRVARDPHQPAAGGAEGACGAALLQHQDGVQKSDVGQEGGSAPQLGWRVCGRLRLPDVFARGEACVCAPPGDGSGARVESASGHVGGAPHRLRHEEQPVGQPRLGDSSRAQDCPLLAGEGQRVVGVEAIHLGECCEVYDLTVEEDHSYLTEGVFSHNCSKPNLQQIPRTADYRSCFRVEEGRVLVAVDYGQIELRIAAQITGDPLLRAIYENDEDAHRRTASIVSGVAYDEVTKLQRQAAKPVNFGLIYGLGAARLVIYSQINYGVTISMSQARQFIRSYFEGYVGVRRWHERALQQGAQTGMARTLWGRLRYLDPEKARNEFYNCLDDQTEALTKRGWVKGFDLTEDDVLLTKNAETGRLEWQKPTDLKKWPDYKGPLIEFRSKSFNAVTTPDHRWLVYNKSTGRDECRVSSKLSLHGDHRIHRTGEYQGPAGEFYGDDFVELCGWWLTDGGFEVRERKRSNDRYVASLFQSVGGNPEKVARIDTLLARLGVDSWRNGPYPYTAQVTWRLDEDISTRLHRIFPDRVLTSDFLLCLSRQQAVRLLDTMIAGDGCDRRDVGGKRSFFASDEVRASVFQMLCVLCGWASSSRERDMSKYKPRSKKLTNVPKMGTIWVVTVLKRDRAQLQRKHRRDFEGTVPVWCPIVPNTYFVVRREGQVYVTGNTPIQGSGADGLKRSLPLVWKRLQKYNGRAIMVHMVHDEILVECDDDFDMIQAVKKDLEEAMVEGIQPMLPDVRVVAEGAYGRSWADAH